MTEQDLCEVFGKYGPLASIKIMYPRSEEERAKNRHTGFVGFMKRSDAEDAFDGLKGDLIEANGNVFSMWKILVVQSLISKIPEVPKEFILRQENIQVSKLG